MKVSGAIVQRGGEDVRISVRKRPNPQGKTNAERREGTLEAVRLVGGKWEPNAEDQKDLDAAFQAALDAKSPPPPADKPKPSRTSFVDGGPARSKPAGG